MNSQDISDAKEFVAEFDKSEWLEGLSKRIQSVLRDADLSLQDLADILGCSVRTVSAWKRGECSPSAHWIHLISIVFDVDADYLINGD